MNRWMNEWKDAEKAITLLKTHPGSLLYTRFVNHLEVHTMLAKEGKEEVDDYRKTSPQREAGR